MTTGFLSQLPEGRFWLRNGTVPETLLVEPLPEGAHADQDGLATLDHLIADGRIAAIRAAGTEPDAAGEDATPAITLDRGMVLPTFVDLHTHLDKGHIWPRRRNPDGTFMGALENVAADRAANWSAEDVRRRIRFSLKSAYAHGTSAIRTHLDSLGPQHRISWPVFEEMRAEWADRIALQASALYGIDAAMNDDFFADIVTTVKRANGILGAVTYMVPDLIPALDRVVTAAADTGLDLDFHVDETADPAARSLRAIAEAALRHRYQGRITVGHCCSLARQDADEADRTLDLVAEAGIAVVSLPMCNMYLQDRVAGRTPRWRGITLLHEMAARGIAVSVASDNTRDPFYAYGDLDGLEVFREAVRIAHLDHPFGHWPRTINRAPADVMRLPDMGRIGVGLPADLVLFRARRFSELLSRPQSDRSVLRAGRLIDRVLPDYRELDDILP
jgi:cytosine deaminase